MLKKIKYKNVSWVDLINPSQEEVTQLTAEYGLHAIIEEELLHPSNRSKIDWSQDHIYLALHFPLLKDDTAEIDFVLGRDFLITTHYQAISSLLEFAQILDGGENGKRKKEENFHAGHLFYYMIRELYNPVEENLEDLNRQLDQIDKQIFTRPETETIQKLTEINRQLLSLKQSIKSHAEILRSWGDISLELYGAKFTHYARALTAEHNHLAEMIESQREVFAELSRLVQSLILIKTGQTLRLLTILTAILLLAILLALILF